MSQAIQRGIIILAVLLVFSVGISVFALLQKKSLETQNQNLQDQLSDAKSKQDKIIADAKNLQQQVRKFQKENSSFNDRLSEKDKEKEQLQSSYDELKHSEEDLKTQAEEANKERDDWKGRLETIRKERDSLMDKLQHQPEKIVYKDKPAEETPAVSDAGSADMADAAPAAGTPQGDEYWAQVLKQKSQLVVELDKAKADLDNSALQVADLRRQNSDLQMQIKDLNNDKTEIERRLTTEKKQLEDNFVREKQELQRKVKDGEDLASNLSMEAARARGDQKFANDFGSKIKDDNAQLQAEVKQLVSTKIALEKTVAHLTQEKNDMGKRLSDTEGVIQDRINEIWQIKQTLDQKITQINQAKSEKEVELPPIVVNSSGASVSSSVPTTEVQGGMHKIISINAKNNFVIIDYGESQGSSIGRIFKVSRGGQEIATLEVIQVRRDISAADIKDQKANLQVGDQVQ